MTDDGYYVNHHESQYQDGASAYTHRNGCVWTSGCNGSDAATGGSRDPEPDYLHSKLAREDETSPATPGWSLRDLVTALGRIGVLFINATGATWGDVVAWHNAGYYVVLQGDSDVFGNGTCSGKFDGDHAIGIHPAEDEDGNWRIDDPICPTARYESPSVLRRYAEKLASRLGIAGLFVGRFARKVPKPEVHDVTVYSKFSIPQYNSIAVAIRDTTLYESFDSATGKFSGSVVTVPKGHTKRFLGNPPGSTTAVYIGNDMSPDVPGKSALLGRRADWDDKVVP